MKLKAICTFPDFTEVPLDFAEKSLDTHYYIEYNFEGLPQSLWVPKEFIQWEKPKKYPQKRTKNHEQAQQQTHQ